MDLFLGDAHFGHASVIEFDNRPFNSVEEMDEYMLHAYNERVYYDNDVWFVGDAFVRSAEPPEWYLKQMKGVKHLIVGNHDVSILKNKKALSYFETVDKSVMLNLDGQQVHVSHFPYAEWNGMYHGWWHVYGHLHRILTKAQELMLIYERALNSAASINGYIPVSFNELKQNNIVWRSELKKEHDYVVDIR